MQTAPLILWLKEINEHDVELVGKAVVQLAELKRNTGKATSSVVKMSEMFVVTTAGWQRFVHENDLVTRIEGRWMAGHKAKEKIGDTARVFKRLIQGQPFPDDLEEKIMAAYLKLGNGWQRIPVRLEVEVIGKKGAGNFLAYRQTVEGETNLLLAVRKGWAEGMALGMKQITHNHIKKFELPVMVVMVEVEEQKNPSVKFRVSSRIEKQENNEGEKERFIIGNTPTSILHTPLSKAEDPSYRGDLRGPLNRGHELSEPARVVGHESLELMAEGLAVSPGVASGQMRVVKTEKELTKVKRNEIVWLPDSGKQWVSVVGKAKAVVSKSGGKISALGMVAREAGVPMVSDIKYESLFKEGMLVTVDGKHGKVYKGARGGQGVKMMAVKEEFSEENQFERVIRQPTETAREFSSPNGVSRALNRALEMEDIRTATKLDVWRGYKDEQVKMKVDGVWLAGEELVKEFGKHPGTMNHELRTKMGKDLNEWLMQTAVSVHPRPLWYRLSSLTSNDYLQLRGGKGAEELEENPWVGRRGAGRFIHEQKLIDWELAVVKNLKHQIQSLNLVIPWVRTAEELLEMKRMLAGMGLVRGPRFEIWVEVTTPLGLQLVEKFVDVGIDGVVISLNDVMGMLVGRELNEGANKEYLRDNDVRLVMEEWVKKAVKVAHAHRLGVAVHGSVLSQQTDWGEMMVRLGVDRVVVGSNEVGFVREAVAHAEGRLVKR